MRCCRRSAWSRGRAPEWSHVLPIRSPSPRWLPRDPEEDHGAMEPIRADDRHPAYLNGVYGSTERADPVKGMCGTVASQRDVHWLLLQRNGFAALVQRAEIV